MPVFNCDIPVVCLPCGSSSNNHLSPVLSSRLLASHCAPLTWVVARQTPLLCKLSPHVIQRICQDPLERFFGCQRQRGGVHDNPNCSEFMKNTQALRVINGLQAPSKGNCRGGDIDSCKENWCTKLPKRKRLHTK